MKGQVVFAVLVAATLTFFAALLEGHYVNRWGVPAELSQAAISLQHLPKKIGSWDYLQDGGDLPEEVTRELGLRGFLSRTYVNSNTRNSITLLLMAGESGRLVRHPPDVCYVSRGDQPIGDPTAIAIEGTVPPSDFRVLEYRRGDSPVDDRFLVAYSLGVNGKWSIPRYPRITYGSAPMLFKVQILLPLNRSLDRKQGTAEILDFANAFCGEFQKEFASIPGTSRAVKPTSSTDKSESTADGG